MKKEKIGYIVLLFLALVAITGMFFIPPIIQNEDYHHFSDGDTLMGIPNFWNVISNLPFLLVGVIALFKLDLFSKQKIQYQIFFIGVALVSIGSGYYHWNPNSNTLIWDRLPMTIAFMALFSIVISEFISDKIGRLLLIPLLLIGFASVIYWVIFKDLRFYALVQFYPMIAIPVILIFFRSAYDRVGGYWLLLLAYIIAKFLEYYDHQVHTALGIMSGHPLKHIAAATGLFILFYAFLKRKQIN